MFPICNGTPYSGWEHTATGYGHIGDWGNLPVAKLLQNQAKTVASYRLGGCAWLFLHCWEPTAIVRVVKFTGFFCRAGLLAPNGKSLIQKSIPSLQGFTQMEGTPIGQMQLHDHATGTGPSKKQIPTHPKQEITQTSLGGGSWLYSAPSA